MRFAKNRAKKNRALAVMPMPGIGLKYLLAYRSGVRNEVLFASPVPLTMAACR
jgi:hypothetical protein